MKHLLNHLLVGGMSMRQRCLSAAAGVALGLAVVFAGLTYVKTEAVPTKPVRKWETAAPDGYCTEEESPCNMIYWCDKPCEEDKGDTCCETSPAQSPACLDDCPQDK